MKETYEVIVIGGGPAGLMAAGQAALNGRRVAVLEKMKLPGRKLGITGKGRCNITNTASLQEFITEISPNGNFLRSSFSQFFSEELILFLHEIGVKTQIERGGRVFPESGKAVKVTKSLIKWCENTGVEIITNVCVNKILQRNGIITAVDAILDRENNPQKISYLTSKVILATGGSSYPATGSTGDGYKLSKNMGHSIRPVYPVLVPLVTEENILKSQIGLELKNIEVTLWIDNKKATALFGEISFMEFGVSGSLILSLSRLIVPELMKNSKVEITLDLKPALDHKKLDNRLLRDLEKGGNDSVEWILKGLLPGKLIESCLANTEIPPQKLGNQVSNKERKRLKNWLKEYRLKITNYRPFSEAIVTAGGIATNEIHQKTMESKLVEGLFFAGEVIDLDGPTGGFNLQIAFSTGWLAGQSV